MQINKNTKSQLILVFAFIVILIVFRGTIPFVSEIGFLFLLLGGIYNNYKNKVIIFKKDKLFVPVWIYIYIFFLLFTGFYARNGIEWLVYIVYFITGLLIYITVVLYVNTKDKLVLFMKVFIFIVTSIAFLTNFLHILQLTLGVNSPLVHVGASIRSVGFYGNPNYYSVSLLLGMTFLFGLFYLDYIKKDNNKNFMLFFATYFILFVGIYLTFSRGALIAAVLVTLLFIVFNFKQFFNVKSLIVTLIFGVLILFLDFGNNSVILQILDQTEVRFENAIYGTGAGRYNIWQDGWELYTSSLQNLLLGVGGNQFMYYYEFNIINNVHNGYLRFLYESGLVGLVLFLIFSIKIFISTFNFKFFSPSSLLFYPFIALLIMALSNDIFIIKEFWLVVGLIFAVQNDHYS